MRRKPCSSRECLARRCLPLDGLAPSYHRSDPIDANACHTPPVVVFSHGGSPKTTRTSRRNFGRHDPGQPRHGNPGPQRCRGRGRDRPPCEERSPAGGGGGPVRAWEPPDRRASPCGQAPQIAQPPNSAYTVSTSSAWRSAPTESRCAGYVTSRPTERPCRRRISRCQHPRCQWRRRSGVSSGTTTRWYVPGGIERSHPGQM